MTYAPVGKQIGIPAYAIRRSFAAPKVAIAPIAQKNGNDRSLPAWFETLANPARAANVAVGAPNGKRWRRNSNGAQTSANGMTALLLWTGVTAGSLLVPSMSPAISTSGKWRWAQSI